MSSEAATTKRPRQATQPDATERGTSVLPVSRVNRIIKADQDVNLCSKEAVFLIAKAAERMVSELTLQSHASARLQKRNKLVKYSDLASVVGQPQWFYLGEVVPAPISLKAAKALRQDNDESVAVSSAVTTSDAAPDKRYNGTRVMGAKKRASLAAAQAGEEGSSEGKRRPGLGDVENSPGKRQTRGKQVDYSVQVGAGDEDDDDDHDEGSMEVDE